MTLPRKRFLYLAPFLVFILSAHSALGQSSGYPYVLKTFAGSFPLGDGGPAAQALLESPSTVVLDGAGNIYVLDSGNFAIRKIDATNTITSIHPTNSVYCFDMKMGSDGSFYVAAPYFIAKIPPTGAPSLIAGTATPGTSADGIAAASATLNATAGIALDAAGNVYFVDGNRVREVTIADGLIHTIAGTQAAAGGYNGDNKDATTALLNSPFGIAVDSANNVYIADRLNARVRKVTKGTISTIAGTGVSGQPVNGPALSSKLGIPYGLTVDSSGNVYMTDTAYNVVVKISAAGALTQMAGSQTYGYSDGPANSTFLIGPTGIAVDGSGNLFVAEQNGNRVREITNGNVRTIRQRPALRGGWWKPATSALLNLPLAVALDGQGDVFIADYNNYRVREVTPSGNISTYAGTGLPGTPADGTQASTGPLLQVTTMATDSKGNLYLAMPMKVLKVAPGGIVSTLAGTGGAGDTGDGAAASKATFQYVVGVAVDASSNVYIADYGANRVRKVSGTDGTIGPYAGTEKVGYTGDGGLATAATLHLANLAPLAVDQKGNLYIGDGGNNVVRMVAPNGLMSTVVGNGTAGDPTDGSPAKSSPFSAPGGIAVDSSGMLYISSTLYYKVYSVDGTGAIHTISGAGMAAVTDGVLANSTLGFAARGIAVDANGDLYVADDGNPYVADPGNVVRKLILNSPSSFTISAGNNQTGSAGSALPNLLAVVVNGRAGVGVPGVTVNFAVAAGAATLSAASAQTDPTGTAGVGVTLGPATGSVIITAMIAGGSAPGVQFTLTAADLMLNPQSLVFSYNLGDPAPAPQTLALGTVSGNPLSFTTAVGVTGAIPWLQVDTASGSTPASVQVTVNPGMLGAGLYQGTITVTAAGRHCRGRRRGS